MNEVVPSKYRAGLVTIRAVMFLIGCNVAGWVGVGFYFWEDPKGKQWRPPLAIHTLWPLLLCACLYWVPESPRWLLTRGRVKEATKILDELHSDPTDPDNAFARGEFYQIQKQVVIDKTLDSSWIHVFSKPFLSPTMLISRRNYVHCLMFRSSRHQQYASAFQRKMFND
jgi:hypothetical protein